MSTNFPQAIASGFKNYVNFRGRASRSEYWYWALFIGLGRLATRIADAAVFRAPLNSTVYFNVQAFTAIFSLIIVLPTFAVATCRLHDVDRSGWWLLMYLTIIGILFPLLYWKCIKGTDGPNRFGDDPLGMGYAARVFE